MEIYNEQLTIDLNKDTGVVTATLLVDGYVKQGTAVLTDRMVERVSVGDKLFIDLIATMARGCVT